MRSKHSLLFIVYGLWLIMNQSLAGAEERFIYDAMNKRDPFIPLIDKDSPSGLRTVFVRPGERVELPMELELNGVLWSGQEYFAIVNQQVIKAGQYLGRVKIAEIAKDRIIVEYAEKRFPIYLRKEPTK
ncbi:hypothetical protein ACFL2I_06635 [Candidatus Omnitrophota bacterium]